MNDIWSHIAPEFSKTENWGLPGRVSGLTLLALSIIRRETGWPVVIHNAFELTGHSANSQHYQGKAVDFHFTTDVQYYRQVLMVEQILNRYQLSEFVGLGIYPGWNNPGFHLDTRGSKARWGFDRMGREVAYEVAKDLARNV